MPVNLGNPVETSILEFAKTINKITGNQSGIVYHENERTSGDPQRRRPDISRATQVLGGWQPTVDLAAGLEKTITFFKKQLGVA